MHDLGDAEQKSGVEGGFAEDFIDVVAGARNLAGQPAYAALVFLQLLCDELSDMDFRVPAHVFCFGKALFSPAWTKFRLGRNGAKENRELFVEARGSGKDPHHKQESSRQSVSVSAFMSGVP